MHGLHKALVVAEPPQKERVPEPVKPASHSFHQVSLCQLLQRKLHVLERHVYPFAEQSPPDVISRGHSVGADALREHT